MMDGANDVENVDMELRDINVVHHRGVDNDERNEQIYMSILWNNGNLGVAYYDVDSTQIHMMLDTIETDDFTYLKKVLGGIEPTDIIVNAKQDERLINILKTKWQPNGTAAENYENRSMENEDTPRILHFLPSIDFSLEISKRRILNLEIPSMPKHYTESEKTIYLSSLVPFDNTNMVCAIGGLLKFLEKMRIGIELEERTTRVPVLDLRVFSLKEQVIIDDITFSALQIFKKESHPSLYKSGHSGSKEGLSLFGFLNRCKSPVGYKLLRLWFLQPLRDIEVLQQRHDAITYLVNPRNIETFTTLTNCLKNVKNIKRILTRMMQAQASIGDWQTLYKTVYHAIYIGDICKSLPQNIEIFRKISSPFNADLQSMASLISKIVDFEKTGVEGRFVVKPGVDAELDERKRMYNGLPDFMTKVAQEELSELSDEIEECNVIYLPQLGYMLAIPVTDVVKSRQQLERDGFEFVFLCGNVLHYKSPRTRELDITLGDTQCEVVDQETSIMYKLQDTILEHSKVLMDMMEMCAELDCLVALAEGAKELNYIRPSVVDRDIIDIKAGRHPLQEMCCNPFVPNDTKSDLDNSKIKILTGPNACGKSIYLKQVALIVYMAHIGSFVPAESATVGCVDRIFTRIQSLESVSMGLSTFMIDINQLSDSLRNATRRSLVVVDEFGKGTEKDDGLALLCSSLLYWIDMGQQCPHILLSTHFHSLMHQQLLPKTPLLKYLSLETVNEDGKLIFLYQLIESETSSSYAGYIASIMGLPNEIVKRGAEVSKLIRENQPVFQVDSEDTETQMKRTVIKTLFCLYTYFSLTPVREIHQLTHSEISLSRTQRACLEPPDVTLEQINPTLVSKICNIQDSANLVVDCKSLTHEDSAVVKAFLELDLDEDNLQAFLNDTVLMEIWQYK